MERWVGKVAVVTGASSGIGASIAENLVKAGLKVVGFARRAELIEEHAKTLSECSGKLYARKVDMTVEQEIIEGFEWTTENVGPVHVLINNAGLMVVTGLAEGETSAWRQVLETNVLSMVIASREAFKIMKANGIDGHIVNINSIAGHKVLYSSHVGLYCASKHAVTAYNECLRQDLNLLGSRVKVTSISPGIVDTKIMEKAGNTLQNLVASFPSLSVQDVSDGIMYALSTPPNVQIHELTMKAIGEKF